jgi:hypothetical protein
MSFSTYESEERVKEQFTVHRKRQSGIQNKSLFCKLLKEHSALFASKLLAEIFCHSASYS